MPVANLITAARAEGFKHVMLNVGALFKDFDYTQYTTAAALKAALVEALSDESKCLGMTRGGGSFTTTREMRQIEADGLRYRYVGDTLTDSIDATLNFTFIEFAPKNIALGLTAVNQTDYGPVHVIQPRTRIEAGDYIQDLVLATDLNNGGVMLIHFRNALNTSDYTISYTDKGEATYPLEFHPYQDNLDDFDAAPYEIIIYDPDDEEPAGAEINLSETSETVSVGSDVTITATTDPDDAVVTWRSSSNAIATVEDGVVTGITTGVAIITATIPGASATCVVTVEE